MSLAVDDVNKVMFTKMKRVENSWLILGTESLFENRNFNIITIPNPSTGTSSKYCLNEKHRKIYEVVTYDEPYRSWFIGETVKSDGKVMILSPIDPVFLVLPKLMNECCDKAIPLEDLLSEKGYEQILDFIDDLNNVADLKGPPDMKAYKYNEGKTLTWLMEKVKRLTKVLRDKNIHVRSGAVSATFVASNVESDTADEDFFLKYAHGIISEYLPEDLSDALANKFDFKTETVETLGKKRKSEITETSLNKKAKQNGEEFNDNLLNISSPNGVSDFKKEKQLTSKEKARQKAASGTKTISSFFTKKTVT